MSRTWRTSPCTTWGSNPAGPGTGRPSLGGGDGTCPRTWAASDGAARAAAALQLWAPSCRPNWSGRAMGALRPPGIAPVGHPGRLEALGIGLDQDYLRRLGGLETGMQRWEGEIYHLAGEEF